MRPSSVLLYAGVNALHHRRARHSLALPLTQAPLVYLSAYLSACAWLRVCVRVCVCVALNRWAPIVSSR